MECKCGCSEMIVGSGYLKCQTCGNIIRTSDFPRKTEYWADVYRFMKERMREQMNRKEEEKANGEFF